MFKGALAKHEGQQSQSALATTLSHPLLPSSPPQQGAQDVASKSVNAAYTNALRPTALSALNVTNGRQPQRTFASGTKRSASGLAKALDGSFEHVLRSPVTSGVLALTKTDLFDENDFDSDIELDAEEPAANREFSYPELPRTKVAGSPANPVFYPSLPRQQQAALAYSVDATQVDSGYGTAPVKQAPPSSAPPPWSSSPAEHHQPTQRPSLSHFMHDDQPRPSKRRMLPWLDRDAQPAATAPTHWTGTATSKVKSNRGFTPLPKDNKKSTYPWNTTASAVKEQQKQLREKAKKLTKQSAGSEASESEAKSKNRSMPRVFLSDEQTHILDLVVTHKKSVFFTGSAGTGKSVLLREIISELRKKYIREIDRVAVTASTGLAACNVGGATLHSYAGIGLGKEDVPELVRKIKRNHKAKQRWLRTKVLVVDEISMVDGDLFDKLEAVARQLRNNGRPFGGMQLIITGDFFQLPPVPDRGGIAKFAFDAATWNTSVEHTIGLHRVFRQKDPVFAGMLNEMREGRLSESSVRAFRTLSRPLNFEDDLDATELFPTRSEVDRANSERMQRLVGRDYVFDARDGGTIVDKVQRDRLLSNCMAQESITLKKGAQVMLIKNIDESMVNGSLGKVIGFMNEQTFANYDANDEGFAANQDGTLKDEGHAAQATSREAMAKQRLTDNLLGSTTQLWPLVRFAIADGTTRDLLCQREPWKVELPNGEVQASRSQIPLILAWALSIHKAQGQTLERVKVDLGRVFEKGQAYVALSRATSMAGLQVTRFDPRKVNAHEKVRTFYQNLSRYEEAEMSREKSTGVRQKSGIKAEAYEHSFVHDEDGVY